MSIRIFISVLFLFFTVSLFAQNDSSLVGKIVVVKTSDGNRIKGTLISDDGRELTITSPDQGRVIIPKYVVTSIEPLTEKNYKSDQLVETNPYPNYYQLSPSAIPMDKNDIQVRLPGLFAGSVDVSASDNLSLHFGVLSFAGYSFGGCYRKQTGEKNYFGGGIFVGGLIGSFGYGSSYSDYSGAMARAFYTRGDKEKNLSIGVGYGTTFSGNYNQFFINAGGMVRVNAKIILMLDGYALPKESAGTLGWAMRILTKRGNAWDVGIQSVIYQDTYTITQQNGQTLVKKGIAGFGFPFLGWSHKF